MANNEGPGGQPPSAWVWSQYRGVLPADPPAAGAPVETPVAAAVKAAPSSSPAAPAAGKHSSMVGLGLAVAVVVIAGLTWLFATKPASEPAPETPPAATETPAAPQKSEAAPAPAAEPAAAPPPAPAQETQKPAETTPAPQHGAKKKKHK